MRGYKVGRQIWASNSVRDLKGILLSFNKIKIHFRSRIPKQVPGQQRYGCRATSVYKNDMMDVTYLAVVTNEEESPQRNIIYTQPKCIQNISNNTICPEEQHNKLQPVGSMWCREGAAQSFTRSLPLQRQPLPQPR